MLTRRKKWGGAPTYILSNYILGVRRELQTGNMTYRWIVDPAWQVVEQLGLSSANGKMPLPGGGLIEVSWSTENAQQTCEVVVQSEQAVSVDVRGPCRMKS